MKRKDLHRRNGLDPRVFSWQKHHRDQFPGLGDRVWLKSERCHGRIVVAAAAALPQEEEGRGDDQQEDATKNTTDRPHGGGHNDQGGVDKKFGSLGEEYFGLCRMVKLENNDGATVTTLRRRHDAVRVYDPPAIVICHSTEDFRLLAQTQDIGESVLEIGCSTGQTSRILWQRCDQWMGWDTGQALVDKLRDEIVTKTKDHRCTALTCCKIDAIIDPENAWKLVNDHFGQTSRGLTVLIDIGGDREVNAVAKILQWALELPNNKELRLVIIKSEKMFALEDPLNWFLTQQDRSVLIKTFPSHPLKAPKRCSPQDPTLPVCRYYNYHKEGCKKGAVCELDHTHCHWCLRAGHIALNCPDR
jgi:hypothetical protein